jgi:DNA repair exonuclease SbcCD nuclease subunit
MVKKIIHLSDIHLRTFKLHKEYSEAFDETIRQINNLIQGYSRNEVRIVITGDYVHQKITISNELLVIGTKFLKQLEEIAPLIIIGGNHDCLDGNKDRLDSITPMVGLLSDLDITYYKGESDCYLDDNIVWCVYSIFDENKSPDIDEARKKHGNDKKYIGLFHGPIVGLKTDLGYEFDHGADKEKFAGCDVVLCGDIHKRGGLVYEEQVSEFETREILIMQAGSLIQQNYGENINKHGFLVWDVETLKYEEYDVKTDFGFYLFSINSLDDIETGSEKLLNG